MTKLSFIPPPPLQPPLLPHHPHHRLDAAPRVLQGPTYTINTRDRRITHNVAKISVDQILDLIAVVYLNITCDLNLCKTLPSSPHPCGGPDGIICSKSQGHGLKW